MDKRKLIKILKKFKEIIKKEKDIDEVILFGSQANGKATKNSDIDLMIVGKEFEKIKHARSKGLRKYFPIATSLDIICYTPEEFKKKKKQITIVKEALAKGIKI